MKKCAYAEAAYEALVKWNKYSHEQATEAIESLSFQEVDDLTWGASKSMIDGVAYIGRTVGLSEQEVAQLVDEMLGRVESNDLTNRVANHIANVLTMPEGQALVNTMALDALTAIHDGWVERESGQFFGKKADKGQQYQYLPIEAIGWHEATSDLLFVAPALRAIGANIDEQAMRLEYTDRAVAMLEHGTLAEQILSGCNGYSAHWTPEIAEAMGTQSFAEALAIQTSEKGFGQDELVAGALEARGIDPINPTDPGGHDTPGNR